MEDPAIVANNISKHYQQFVAVDKLSFSVPQGSIYGFLGPNGSGKSTTLRMMLDLIRPSSGNIFLFGKQINTDRGEIFKRIGCIVEKPDFYNYLSAHENLMQSVRAFGLSTTKEQFESLYKKVDLWGRQHDKVNTYSHGMKQRLGLAQALLHNPDLIILDEPNTGLDPQGIIDLRNIIVELNREEGKTIVFSSHILSEVQTICTDMLIINKGHKVVEGKVSDLLSQADLLVRIELSHESVESFTTTTWYQLVDERRENTFQLRMGREQIPALLQDIQSKGITVYRLDYRNQLEDYFLKITNTNQAHAI